MPGGRGMMFRGWTRGTAESKGESLRIRTAPVQTRVPWKVTLSTNVPQSTTSKTADAPTVTQRLPGLPGVFYSVSSYWPPQGPVGCSVLPAGLNSFVWQGQDSSPGLPANSPLSSVSSCFSVLTSIDSLSGGGSYNQDLMLLVLLRIWSAVGFKGSNCRFYF